jgi:hypothetical protein
MSRQGLVAGVFSKFLSASITTLTQFLSSHLVFESLAVCRLLCASLLVLTTLVYLSVFVLIFRFLQGAMCASPSYRSLHALVLLCVFSTTTI